MKTLFAPIGDPKNYKEVEYVVDGSDHQYPTKASFDAIRKALSIDHVVVYAGLSLCDLTKNRSYEDCVNYVTGYVKDKLNINDIDLIVAPNVFGNTFVQEDRKNTLFFNFIYYNTLKLLEDKKPDEVYIDITHGINYMPLLATDAIKLASYTYMVNEKEALNLSTFNSEPVVQGVSGPYHITRVYEEKTSTRLSLLHVLSPFLSKDHKNKVQNNVLKGETQCDVDLIYSSVTALFSGIFPYIALIKGGLEQCFRAVEDKLSVVDYMNFRVKTEVRDEGGASRLVYKDKLPVELSHLHSFLDVVMKVTSNVKAGDEVRLSDIEEMAKKFSVSETVRSMVLNEVDLMKKRGIGKEPRLYAEILANSGREGDERRKAQKECDSNRRNLYAHAGFEQNVTYLRKEGDEIYVSYGKCLENVKNHLK
ncbi:CRISPR-associated CARF protein Csx1 [Stygiolobus caldivivus]|uniref:CRISPR-associated protein n=1 Tax=Stygiolobus caldivivus TaxID=2824673 RepID=A0A8D5U781_9CREN|nr:CRISPR-associated CARF protein Csx1 [Stygiolobus caldivivus]BCU70116.1 CRISPR-associated protein [Stygiolobus caldivivus]